MSEIKLSGTTVIDNTGGTVTVDANQLQIASTTVIDNNKKLSNLDIVPNSSFMFRNKIINGNFDIWQRGTSQTSSGYGSADRWFNIHSGSTKTASQQAFNLGQTDVPGNSKYYLRHVVSSVAGDPNYCIAMQKIEGVDTLAGQTATLSFWAKADSNKNIATEFLQYFGTGGSPSTLVNTIGVTTHNLTTSWQKFTATVAVPSISGKTLGSNGDDRLELNFWFGAGSNFHSRTNSLGQPSNGTTYEVDIAQVQLEEGTVPTPFEHRPIGTELALCQRYYEKSFNLSTAPANNTAETTVIYSHMQSGYGYAVPIIFKERKRAAGASTIVYNPFATTANRAAWVSSSNQAFTHSNVYSITEIGFYVLNYSSPVATPDSTGNIIAFNWSAESEL